MQDKRICTNRVFVQEEVYEVFVEKFQKAVGRLKVGDGFGDGTTVGPLIDENAVSKVQEHIEDAIQKVEQFYMVVKRSQS